MVGSEGTAFKEYCSSWITTLRQWARDTTEAIVGAVTGPLTHPSTLLLGRYSPSGRMRLVARTTQLPPSLRREVGHLLTRAGPEHPWQDMRITTHWGSREPLSFTCVAPHLVAEFVGDSSIDHGRWRHPVQAKRIRTDLAPQDVPPAY